MGSIVKYIITTINPILLNMLAGSPLLNRVNHGSEFSNNNFTTHPMQLNKVHIQFILQNCFTAALHQVQYSYPWSRYCSLCMCFRLARHQCQRALLMLILLLLLLLLHSFVRLFKVEFLWVPTTELVQFLGRGRVVARGLYRRRVAE